jgi:IclR family transcriptional regulator, acetate operon repressor
VPVKRLSTVENAFRVLIAVSERQPVGLGALARLLELDKAAVQRILATLADLGWIALADPPTLGWELTPEALVVGSKYAPQLRERARSHLESIQAETGETMCLVTVDRGRERVVVVDVVDSAQPLRVTIPVGFDAPLGDFQPFLAFFPDDSLDSLRGAGVYVLTKQQQAAHRLRGWYVLEMEELDVRAVGAPVPGPFGNVLAALLLVAPRTRLPRDRQIEVGERLRRAAASIASS